MNKSDEYVDILHLYVAEKGKDSKSMERRCTKVSKLRNASMTCASDVIPHTFDVGEHIFCV